MAAVVVQVLAGTLVLCVDSLTDVNDVRLAVVVEHIVLAEVSMHKPATRHFISSAQDETDVTPASHLHSVYKRRMRSVMRQ